ncbi:MAG: hypothetical protein ACRDQ1_18435 [Sciscionella sp.]
MDDPAPEYEHRVFSSKPARVLGWCLYAVAAFNFVDLAIQGRDHASLVAGAALLLGCGVVYVLCLRPGIVARSREVVLHNPLRDVTVGWQHVDEVDVTDAIRVHAGDRVYRSFALQETSRTRARARMRRRPQGVPDRVAEAVAGRSHCGYIAQQLTEMARERAVGASSEPAVTWYLPAVLAVAVPAVLLLAAVLIH